MDTELTGEHTIMTAIEKQIKQARLAGSPAISLQQYEPSQYSERQKKYFNTETRLFTEYNAKYSGDYILVQAQGLNPAEPFEYTTVHMRFSDIVRSSSAISYEFDNFKVVDIAERQYTYLRIGAKIIAMGSTWLVINPDNMSNVLGKAIIQRCDAVWHYLDYYGNVCAEPMCFDKRRMKANDSDSQRATMVTKGYFDCKMQYNDATSQLFTNSRMILGTSAYRITGYSDFVQEFTEDINSVNLLEFDVRYEEPNDDIDDMQNRVAGGKTFKWDIQLSGTPTMKAGETSIIAPSSIRTAEDHTAVAESTEEHPVSYEWSSSDEAVATVDADGTVHATGEGQATIICTLEQNKNISSGFDILVAGSAEEPHVAFASTTPDKLRLFDEISVTAEYYEAGEAVVGAEIVYELSGADKRAYSYTVSGGTITVKCWAGSVTPLTVTAKHDEYEASFELHLEGI